MASRLAVVGALLCAGCHLVGRDDPGPGAPPFAEVRSWMLLSSSVEDDLAVIAQARDFGINQIQLTYQLGTELRELRHIEKRERVLDLARAAHQAGVAEVLVWDRALYNLDHYPAQFRKNGRLDLDDPAFWKWLKQDYRQMLDLLPGIDGVVLTIVDGAARVDDQRSAKRPGRAQKLAAVVDAVADVVIGERKLRLYARSFATTRDEDVLLREALALIKRREVRLVMKEAPYEPLLTHPLNATIGTIARPTVVEFDVANEFSGQGQIANTWPEVIVRRWGALQQRPHVIGYTARIDRFGPSRVIGRPSEILLHALRRKTEDPSVTADTVYDEFIRTRYGAGSLPHVKAAFQTAEDVVSGALYTLGTCTVRHSALDYDAYDGIWGRHLSAKWLEPPEVRVGHGVGRSFHVWKEVFDRLAPPRFKTADGPLRKEAGWALDRGWVTPEEQMTEGFLRLVATEKTFAVARAGEAVRHIEAARDDLAQPVFYDLHDYFQRTFLTARLHRAVATAYFGYRVWARGEEHRTASLAATVRESLAEIPVVVAEMKKLPTPARAGVWKWSTDTVKAMEYYEKITVKGWPEYGGVVFAVDPL